MGSEIICREYVKPSFPTPQNLGTYNFSLLEQLSPPSLGPIVLYFPNTLQITNLDSFISETTQKLKQSLSLILTRFYPFAGRINSNGESIDCNDEGVPFVVAKIKGHTLSDLANTLDQKSLHFLFPYDITSNTEYGPDFTVALIQVNYFDCGGIAIGASFEHKVIDAVTLGTFLNAWADVTRVGPTVPVCPNYILQSLFPFVPGLPKPSLNVQRVLQTGNPVIKHYVFDASAISSLKSKLKGATRVEAITALIWKCFMAASLAHNCAVSTVTHPVNMRRRAHPPFSSDCFGSFAKLSVAAARNEDENELGVLASKVREAMRKIDHEFVDRIRDGLSGERENGKLIWGQIPKQPDYLFMASWCGFGLYNMDFGWGKPCLVAKCDVAIGRDSKFMNTVWLTDSRNGDGGIEAWIVLDEKYMEVFENVEELRAFATVDQK